MVGSTDQVKNSLFISFVFGEEWRLKGHRGCGYLEGEDGEKDCSGEWTDEMETIFDLVCYYQTISSNLWSLKNEGLLKTLNLTSSTRGDKKYWNF